MTVSGQMLYLAAYTHISQPSHGASLRLQQYALSYFLLR
jgi:hypothetical protein